MVHGYGQNAESFRKKTGAIRRTAKQFVGDWHFVEAHLDAPPREELKEGPGGKAWWLWNQSYTNPINTGWKESLDQLTHVLETEGPFDGVFGFSQGASMVSLLIAEQNRTGKHLFDFAVLIGGFLPRMEEMRNLIVSGVAGTPVKTWHSFGEKDEIIPSKMSMELVDALIPNATVCPPHPGGHLVSSSKEVRDSFKSWISSL
jgi:predicted esterase